MTGGGYKPFNLSKRKGFTLIELLAVIVILAVIALIVVPTVLNIIEKAKKGAAMASADSYIKAVETYILTSELDNSLEKLTVGKTYSTSKLNNLVEVKGTKPQTGEITVGEKGNITSAELTINGYIIKYDGEEYTVIGKDNNIYVQNITVEKEKEVINVGETISLKAVIQPSNATDKTVTWTSSDTSVATISSRGLVTGIKGGTVTLTAKTKNGVTASTNIKVYNLPNYGTTIQNDYTSIYVKNGDEIKKIEKKYETYYSGNYNNMKELREHILEDLVSTQINSGPYITNPVNPDIPYSIIVEGDNMISLLNTSNLGSWFYIDISGGWHTSSITISNFKIEYTDGNILTLQESVGQKYIEPLVIASSVNTRDVYFFDNFNNIITGKEINGSFSSGHIIFKAKNKAALKSIRFHSLTGFNQTKDGINVYQLNSDIELSTQSFE